MTLKYWKKDLNDKIINNLVCLEKTKLIDVLRLINKNGYGICFVTSETGKLIGSVSDGDVRRALIASRSLDDPIQTVMNSNPIYFSNSSFDSSIVNLEGKKANIIPICNDDGVIIDIHVSKNNNVIPFLDPKLDKEELSNIIECIETNWISSQGKFISQFERLFQEKHTGYHAITVSNGTAALHLAMVTLGIGPGDEVIIPNVTFAACANSVIHSGATPVLCEINETFCMDIEQCEKLITKNTKAIMLVHLYGKIADVQGARKLALKYGLKIIEDCAEALGSQWKCERAGTFGDAATFSFFGNKTITTGEGGMLLFKSQKDYEKAKILRDHGMNPKLRYWHEHVGFNYRMTNLQAAIGLAQLSKLDQIIDRKVQIMDRYNKNLKGYDKVVYTPVAREYEINSNWIYTIRLASEIDITKLSAQLEKSGIQTRRVFYPLSDMPIYKSFPKSANLENSRSVSEQGLCLPTSLHLIDDQIDYICNQLVSLLEKSLVKKKRIYK